MRPRVWIAPVILLHAGLAVRTRQTENHWKASIFAEGSNRSATTVEVVE